jgi:hypothetical protein
MRFGTRPRSQQSGTSLNVDQSRLRDILAQFFNEGELRDLCFDLGVDYDDLPGEGKADRARELVGRFYRRGEGMTLLQAIRKRRPNAFWQDTLERTVDEATRPTREISALALRQASGRTGPLRDDYRALLRLSLERIHERMDTLTDLVWSVRTIALSALILALVLAAGFAIGAVIVLMGLAG